MPGIVGIIKKGLSGNEEEKLEIMLASMLHEPFYNRGKYIDKENGYFIGYVSIGQSFSDCMPIYNEKRDVILFLTGECYFDDSEIKNIKEKGHEFNSENASILVHIYEELGEQFFQSLNGWYNGIILDYRQKKAILFNDRYGIRRIHYYETEDAFYFSSEAKSLLKIFPSLRNADPRSMGEYLVYDCVLENRTFFSNIFLLPTGSAWEFDHGNIKKKTYFDPTFLENQEPLSNKDFVEELSNVFIKILPRYFREKNVIGLANTGGLDTRMILACLKPAPGELPCYTFGGRYKDIFDVRIAPKVAKICQQVHQVLRMDDEKYLSEYPFHLERSIYVTDGIVRVDHADVIYFNKMAREIAPIRMTGKYASQVLKSVLAFQDRSPYEQLINPDFITYLSKARETCSKYNKGHNFSFLLYHEIAEWWNGVTVAESSQVAVRSPYLDNDLIKVLYRAPSMKLNVGADFQLKLIAREKPELMAIPTTGTYGGNYNPLKAKFIKEGIKLLSILDKLHIRERLPYSLTHFVGRVDSLLSPLHLDKLIMGFAEFRRYRVWYRDQLSGFLREFLLCPRTYNRPYWDKNYLEKIVNGHINGKGTYLREIRKVLQVESIHRFLLENI